MTSADGLVMLNVLTHQVSLLWPAHKTIPESDIWLPCPKMPVRERDTIFMLLWYVRNLSREVPLPRLIIDVVDGLNVFGNQ